jgi:hypothetical protein
MRYTVAFQRNLITSPTICLLKMKNTCLSIALFILLLNCNPSSKQKKNIASNSPIMDNKELSDSIVKPDTLDALIQRPNGFLTVDAFVRYIKLDSTASNQQIKSILPKLFPYSIPDSIYIQSIKCTNKKVHIYNFGEASLFEIILDGLPMIALKQHCLVWSKKTHKVALLPIEAYQPIKTKLDTNACLIGGYFNQRRGYIHYLSYISNSTKDTFKSVFNTMDYCKNGHLRVGNSSFGCISYEPPFIFKMHNNDLNNDGYADMRFTGIINVYCDSIFEGDRGNSTPLKKISADIAFYANPKDNSFNWTMKDTSICEIMEKPNESPF